MSSAHAECDTSWTSGVVKNEGVHGHLDNTKTNEVPEKLADMECEEAGDRNSQCYTDIEDGGQVARESHTSEVFPEVEESSIAKKFDGENCVEPGESKNDNIAIQDKPAERTGDEKRTSIENENGPNVDDKLVSKLVKEVEMVSDTPESCVKSTEDKMIEPQEFQVLPNTVEYQNYKDRRKNIGKGGYESDDSICSRITILFQNDCNQNKEDGYDKTKLSDAPDCVPTNGKFCGNDVNCSSNKESHEINNEELMIRNDDSEGISEAANKSVIKSSISENIVNASDYVSNLSKDATVKKSQVIAQVAVTDVENEQNINDHNERCEMKDEKDIGCDSSTECLTVNLNNNLVHSELDKVGTTSIILGEREKETKEREKNCISTCASLSTTENKCSQHKGEEPQEIDNSELEKEVVETQCIPERNTLEKVLLELVSESSVQSTLDDGDGANKDHPEISQISAQMVPDEQVQMQITTPVKAHNTCPSPVSSPVNKSPLFKRGLFPRIALKDSGIRSIRRLEKQLFKEREKREKRERKSEIKNRHSFHSSKDMSLKKRDVMRRKTAKDDLSTLEKTTCDKTQIPNSTNCVELKCLRICLVKIDNQMLSKYNVNLPSLQSQTAVKKEANVSIPSYDELLSVDKNGTDQLSDPNTEVVPQVLKVGSTVGDKQIQDKQLVHNMQDACKQEKSKTLCTIQTVVKSISYSRRKNRISDLENSAVSSRENGNDLLDSLVSVNELKRRTDSEESNSSAMKKLKLSNYKPKLKIAKVHILKIDNSVLSKYGYDTQDIHTANAAIVAYPNSTDSSVIASAGNEINIQKPNANQRVNIQRSLNRPVFAHSKINDTLTKSPMKVDMYSPSKRNSENKFVNMKSKETKRGIMSLNKSIDSINLKTLRVVLTNIEDVPPYNSVSLQKWPTTNIRKSKSRPRGTAENSNNNLKTANLNASKIENLSLSSRINLKKSPTLDPAQSLTRARSLIKNDCINLKTPKVILQNIEDTTHSSPVASKKMRSENALEAMSKKERTARVANKDSNIASKGIINIKSPSKKKNVFDQSQDSKEVISAKEAKKREKILRENKTIANDYSKENLCLNGEPVHLKCVSVSVFKLDSVALSKVLSSNSVVFSS